MNSKEQQFSREEEILQQIKNSASEDDKFQLASSLEQEQNILEAISMIDDGESDYRFELADKLTQANYIKQAISLVNDYSKNYLLDKLFNSNDIFEVMRLSNDEWKFGIALRLTDSNDIYAAISYFDDLAQKKQLANKLTDASLILKVIAQSDNDEFNFCMSKKLSNQRDIVKAIQYLHNDIYKIQLADKLNDSSSILKAIELINDSSMRARLASRLKESSKIKLIVDLINDSDKEAKCIVYDKINIFDLSEDMINNMIQLDFDFESYLRQFEYSDKLANSSRYQSILTIISRKYNIDANELKSYLNFLGTKNKNILSTINFEILTPKFGFLYEKDLDMLELITSSRQTQSVIIGVLNQGLASAKIKQILLYIRCNYESLFEKYVVNILYCLTSAHYRSDELIESLNNHVLSNSELEKLLCYSASDHNYDITNVQELNNIESIRDERYHAALSKVNWENDIYINAIYEKLFGLSYIGVKDLLCEVDNAKCDGVVFDEEEEKLFNLMRKIFFIDEKQAKSFAQEFIDDESQVQTLMPEHSETLLHHLPKNKIR